MKSIGFFWTNSKEKNECCRKCPHLKDDTTQSNSASNEQTGDEFEFQINLWNSDVKSTVTNEKYRFRAVILVLYVPCLFGNSFFCFLLKQTYLSFMI